jgi:hypothetical protein
MFQKATKEAAKLRAAIFGPSGAGKTFTSLRLATGIGGPIALIDSERRTASKYADRFQFDVCNLGADEHRVVDYVRAIRDAGQAGYSVLIIDSLTHAWQQLLAEVDALAKAKYRGNTWSAWSEGTPLQKCLVDAILDYPGHVIATMRSKTEWTTEAANNGKSAPKRVGLTPEQGKGIEYEFDMLFELSTEHILTVIKDRSGKFQDRCITDPSEALGSEMAAWLDDGAKPLSMPEQITAKARAVGLTAKGLLSLLLQCNGGKPGMTLEAMPPKLQAQILNQALNSLTTIQAWNAGIDSRTGQPLESPEAPEPVAATTTADPEPDHEAADDPDDLPAAWAA